MSGAGVPYRYLSVHRSFLRDRVRNETYRRAIFAAVQPGDVVLDVGAGTGILSVFAAQAGAKRVYAVERTRMANLARQIVKANAVEDCVKVIRGDIQTATLPERVDVIVSEWLGGYGVDENMLPLVILARDRWLKRGGTMLPERVSAWMAPAWDKDFAYGTAFLRRRPFALNLDPVLEATAHEFGACQHHITEGSLVAAPQPMWTTDLYRCAVAEARGPFRASRSFRVERDARVNVLAAWFRAEFPGDTVLTNAPGAPRTHWGRYVFPLQPPVPVGRARKIAVEFTCAPAGLGHCHQAWSVRVGDAPWQRHDTREGY
jgi:SAM-dependent methyltransferase